MSAAKKHSRESSVSKHPNYALKVEIEGPGVHKKSIAIPDLIHICEAIQSAVHRQAEVMERPTAQTLRRGPITTSAQQECTLELTSITAGSTALSFKYAKPQQSLPMPGSTNFGADVLVRVAEAVKGFEKKKRPNEDIDPGVLDSLRALGQVLDRKAIARIKLDVPYHNGKRTSVKAVINTAVRARIEARVRTPKEVPLTIEGKLEMADFKEAAKACRIHPPIGLSVQCSFEPELEEHVYAALRRPARLTGRAKINPNTGRPQDFRIEKIEILDELLLGAKDFFARRSLEQLAEAQGVSPLANPAELTGGWPEDENVDEFVTAVQES
jgi:hypothetical protein